MKAIGKRILIVLIIVMLVMGGTAGGILAEEKETSSSTEPTVSQDLQQADSQSSVTASSTAASEETVAPTTKVDLNQATDESVTGQKTEESPAKTESVNGANIVYSTHVQNVGWQDAVSNGDISGTTGMSYRLEGIRIAINGADMGVTYRTHVQDYGWQPYVNDNEVSGTVGQAKRLEAIQIDLTGNQASQFDVYYRVHAQDYGWLDWAKNGQMAGTEGLSKRLEAIQIQLVAKGGSAPGTTTRPYVNQDNAFMVKYQTHVQDIGWQNYVGDGNTSGTQGQSKRLEAIQIKLGSEVSGGIQYRTHIQNVGWENSWTSDGNLSGTQGQSLRLEAIQIELTGDAANQYDVYYRVHAQNIGWMGWAKNGESAGTEGYAYRLEAIQIQLVSKGGTAPGTTDNAFLKYVNNNEISQYMGQPFSTAINRIGNLHRANSPGGGITYGNSNMSMKLQDCYYLNKNYSIIGREFISGNCDYTVFGVSYGMNVSMAKTKLVDAGFTWRSDEIGNAVNMLYFYNDEKYLVELQHSNNKIIFIEYQWPDPNRK